MNLTFLPRLSRAAQAVQTHAASAAAQNNASTAAADELAAYVENLFREADQSRSRDFAKYLLCNQFYAGNQHVSYSESQRRFLSAKRPGRIYATDNRILPAVTHTLAMLNQRELRFETVAASGDPHDSDVARATLALLEYWQAQDWCRSARQEAVMNCILYGSAFAKVRWDSAQDEPALELLSPFEVNLYPLGARRWNQVRAVMHTSLVHLDDLKQQFGEAASGVQPQWNAAAASFAERSQYRIATEDPASGGVSAALLRDHVLIHEYRERASAQYPAGREILTCQGRVLRSGPNPLHRLLSPLGAECELGYQMFRHFPQPGRIWGLGLVESLLPLQVAYNRIMTVILRHAQTYRPILINPELSGIDKSLLTNETGLVLDCNPNYVPQYIPAPPLPQHLFQEAERLCRAMDNLSAYTELERGSSETQTLGGLSLLAERNANRFSPIVTQHENVWQHCFRMLLALGRQLMPVARQIRIAGADLEAETLTLRAADLTADIRVVSGSSMPRSLAGDEQRAMRLFELGAIDRTELRRAARFPGLVETDPQYSSRQRAKLLCWRLLQNPAHTPELLPGDDFLTMLEEVRQYQHRPEFYTAAARRPEITSAFAEFGAELERRVAEKAIRSTPAGG